MRNNSRNFDANGQCGPTLDAFRQGYNKIIQSSEDPAWGWRINLLWVSYKFFEWLCIEYGFDSDNGLFCTSLTMECKTFKYALPGENNHKSRNIMLEDFQIPIDTSAGSRSVTVFCELLRFLSKPSFSRPAQGSQVAK